MSFFFFLIKSWEYEISTKLHILSMLNDLNALISFEIELKIRGYTLPLFAHKTYYLIISFYCNCISTLNSLFLRKSSRLVDQYFLLGGPTPIFFI